MRTWTWSRHVSRCRDPLNLIWPGVRNTWRSNRWKRRGFRSDSSSILFLCGWVILKFQSTKFNRYRQFSLRVASQLVHSKGQDRRFGAQGWGLWPWLPWRPCKCEILGHCRIQLQREWAEPYFSGSWSCCHDYCSGSGWHDGPAWWWICGGVHSSPSIKRSKLDLPCGVDEPWWTCWQWQCWQQWWRRCPANTNAGIKAEAEAEAKAFFERPQDTGWMVRCSPYLGNL